MPIKMSKSMKEANPFVKVIVNYSDVDVIINAIKNLQLMSAEKREVDCTNTVAYLEKRKQQRKNFDQLILELHMTDDIPYLLRSIETDNFLTGYSSNEIRSGELWTLPELIKTLPEEYEKQLMGKKISLFD